MSGVNGLSGSRRLMAREGKMRRWLKKGMLVMSCGKRRLLLVFWEQHEARSGWFFFSSLSIFVWVIKEGLREDGEE